MQDELVLLEKQFHDLPKDADSAAINKTAADLERYKYHPNFIIDTPNFLHFTKADMLSELEKISKLTDEQIKALGLVYTDDTVRIKKDHCNMLLYEYELLCGLRQGLPEAWDVIHELYEDD